MHVHYLQEEAFAVRRGLLGYQLSGGPPRFAGPGEAVVFRADEPHRFWNAGGEDLLCAGSVEPAHDHEYFLGALFQSQKRSGGSRPNLLDAAFLARRYRGKFGLLAIPAPVQRLVFPAVVAIGTLFGRYEKYADALEPVRH